MTHTSRRLILVLTASVTTLALLVTSRVSTAQTGISWTGLVSATTSGSGLTPTASNGRGESSQSIPAGDGSLKVYAYSSGNGESTSFGLTNAATFTGGIDTFNAAGDGTIPQLSLPYGDSILDPPSAEPER